MIEQSESRVGKSPEARLSILGYGARVGETRYGKGGNNQIQKQGSANDGASPATTKQLEAAIKKAKGK